MDDAVVRGHATLVVMLSIVHLAASFETTAPAVAPFYMYEGAAFPSPEDLLACRGVKRLAPLEEPMAQFYSEIGLVRSLATHPARVHDPAQAAWCRCCESDWHCGYSTALPPPPCTTATVFVCSECPSAAWRDLPYQYSPSQSAVSASCCFLQSVSRLA